MSFLYCFRFNSRFETNGICSSLIFLLHRSVALMIILLSKIYRKNSCRLKLFQFSQVRTGTLIPYNYRILLHWNATRNMTMITALLTALLIKQVSRVGCSLGACRSIFEIANSSSAGKQQTLNFHVAYSLKCRFSGSIDIREN